MNHDLQTPEVCFWKLNNIAGHEGSSSLGVTQLTVLVTSELQILPGIILSKRPVRVMSQLMHDAHDHRP